MTVTPNQNSAGISQPTAPTPQTQSPVQVGQRVLLRYDPQYLDEGQTTVWAVTVTKIWDDGDFDVEDDSDTWTVGLEDIRRGVVSLETTPPTAPPSGVPPTSAPPGATSSSDTSLIADELIKLADLHKRGVLTDEEFAAQKARLLGRSG
jgi:hypothetical protein